MENFRVYLGTKDANINHVPILMLNILLVYIFKDG